MNRDDVYCPVLDGCNNEESLPFIDKDDRYICPECGWESDPVGDCPGHVHSDEMLDENESVVYCDGSCNAPMEQWEVTTPNEVYRKEGDGFDE